MTMCQAIFAKNCLIFQQFTNLLLNKVGPRCSGVSKKNSRQS